MNTFAFRNKLSVNYFEGWYIRFTDENNNLNYAIIFGVTKESSDPHSFIQIYDGANLTNSYERFKVDDFSYLNHTVYIKDNFLSKDSLHINIGGIEINLKVGNQQYLSGKKNNSAMSFLVHFPLECFQDVIYMDALFEGEVTINNKLIYTTGKAYMEKTYGNKFPKKWIWLQGNHFNEEISFSFAHGIIPVLKFEKKGFFAILRHNSKEYRFASYNLAKLKIIEKSKSELVFIIKKGKYKIEVSAEILKPVKLVGPSDNGIMNLDVFESINSFMHIKFSKGKNILFKSTGTNVGIESMYND